jgi:uncharacterized damage-inducible protein DinB
MIDPAFVRTMARYNSWQNNQLMPVIAAMPLKDLTKDRGAFFSSILATANHLLWGDTLWMSRFDPSVQPPKTDVVHTDMHATGSAWAADRFRLDGKIRFWAEGLRGLDLTGDLEWYNARLDRHFCMPRQMAIMQLFNHQTHHRGQIHAMLTAAGATAPVTDLIFMPEEA